MGFRAAIVLVAVCVVGAASAQIWEKRLAAGVAYRMEIDAGKTRVIHSLRVTTAAPDIQLQAELAQLRVYAEGDLKGRETLSALVRRTGAFAGINADFFPYTGDPLGGMIRNREIISRPFANRPVFAWGPSSSEVGFMTWSANARHESKRNIPIGGINEEPSRDVVLFTSSSGMVLAKQPSLIVLLQLIDGKPEVDGTLIAVVKSVHTDLDSVAVPEGHVALAARGSAQSSLAGLRQGEQFVITLTAKGLDWSKFDQVVGGGPHLLKNGKVFIDWKEGGFKEAFALKPHPRSAIGKNRWGDIFLVTVDGRGPHSLGVTLSELAGICLQLGMTDAINLDGGGSTSLNLFGTPVNRPSDGSERPIANAILLFGTPARGSIERVIRGPAELSTPTTFALVNTDGSVVPPIDVVWTATGAGWIDQGGTLYPISTGTATVTAMVLGQRHSVTVQVNKT